MKTLIFVFFVFVNTIQAQTIFEFSKIESSIKNRTNKIDKVKGTIEINSDTTEFKLNFLGNETIEKISLHSYYKHSDTDEYFFYEIDNPEKESFNVFVRNNIIFLIIIQSRLNTYSLDFY